MSYQVLARKWRPREFSSLIGQQAVVTALTNALRDGKIAQAYLFSGIRGVGKTTAARLFAKALNCEKGPEVGPCNECATCRDITAGSDMDVLEIDAATYSKVEQVRELSESLKYGPTRDRYKVVVLDEVHRLSRQAFDALLKIVEEPPPRLVFIFATTEADAVPATILSRCQEFHFRRVGASEVALHLAEICRAESIRASDRALRLVARAGEGSVRDSVALLDQLATYGSGEVLEEEASRLVGGLDLALFGRLLGAIVNGDSAAVAGLAREVEEQGWDPRQVHAHFLGYCKDALHLSLGGAAALSAVDLPQEEAAIVSRIAQETGYENLLRLLHHLLSSEATVRRSDAAQLALELAWLRAAELPKLLRVEELLAGGSFPGPTGGARTTSESAPSASVASGARTTAPRPARPAPPASPTPPTAPATTALRIAPSAPPEAPPAELLVARESARSSEIEPPAAEPSAARPKTPASASSAPSGNDEERIERFREELSARRPTLAARLAGAKLDWRDGALSIALVGDDPLEAAQLARNSNRELIDEAAAAAFGAGTRWRLIEAATNRRPTATAAPAGDGGRGAVRGDAPPAAKAASDPRVQAVLDIFGGGVQSVARADAKSAAHVEAGADDRSDTGADSQVDPRSDEEMEEGSE